MRIFSKSVQDPETIILADRRFDVSVNRLKRARRLTLRIDTNASRVKISAPASVDAELVHGFLERNRPWLERQIASRPDLEVVRDGSLIPFRGQETQIVIDPAAARITFDGADGRPSLRCPGGASRSCACSASSWTKPAVTSRPVLKGSPVSSAVRSAACTCATPRAAGGRAHRGQG